MSVISCARGAGSSKRWFHHFVCTKYLLYAELWWQWGGYNSGDFPILYNVLLSQEYVFDFVATFHTLSLMTNVSELVAIQKFYTL